MLCGDPIYCHNKNVSVVLRILSALALRAFALALPAPCALSVRVSGLSLVEITKVVYTKHRLRSYTSYNLEQHYYVLRSSSEYM